MHTEWPSILQNLQVEEDFSYAEFVPYIISLTSLLRQFCFAIFLRGRPLLPSRVVNWCTLRPTGPMIRIGRPFQNPLMQTDTGRPTVRLDCRSQDGSH